MAKARNWSLKQTLFTTVYCGLGHVASSIVISFAGMALGYGISHIEGIESVRGSMAGWAFFIFGLAYMIWGIFKAVKNRPHSHAHSHGGGGAHIHEHTHSADHIHAHAGNARSLTPWVLFVIFVLGPCEILIPLVMAPAANCDINGIAAVALLFSAVTVSTMCATVTVGYYGFKILPTAKIDRFMHAIAGATISLSGFAILFLKL
jgi:ABC-type nickel/cobalt efflux system permease component RcnA